MKLRIAALAGLLLAGLTLTAQEPEPPTKAKIYKTPQAAFDDFWASLKKGDFKTTIEALAPESQKQAAVDFAFQGLREREGPLFKDGAKDGGKDTGKGMDEERKKKFKPVFDVMDKYGLTEKATKDIPRTPFGRGSKKAREDMAKLIRKPEAFALDMLKALNKVEPRRIGGGDREAPKLADVKIDGAKATGNLVHTIEFKDKDKVGKSEHKQPVEFLKINGGWRIIPDAGRRYDDDDPKDKGKDGVKDKREFKDK